MEKGWIPSHAPCFGCGKLIAWNEWYDHTWGCLAGFDWTNRHKPGYVAPPEHDWRFVANMFDQWKDREPLGVIAQHEMETNGYADRGCYCPPDAITQRRTIPKVNEFSALAFDWDPDFSKPARATGRSIMAG